MKQMKTKTIKAWGGFSDGKLHKILIDNGWGGFGQNKNPSLAVFLTRAEAKEQYQDVRRIEIKYEVKD